ncbi:hypothetical protein [Sphingomonas pituitosa]|uniref:hypothetical protein n=1 Tax=Sphingomonas pituitosa TaxID=99597 RepID=UPI000830918F|nr:hypothetical protein [Sphingomonas pituitosa]
MPHIIDIGGTPANENCAQLGQTEDFERLNRLEVAAYKAALIGRFGPPPEGCELVELRNPHDFGRYFTLGIRIADEDAAIAAAASYIEQVENGLGTWLEAGFTAPVSYDDAGNAVQVRELSDVIVSALLITRPTTDGVFAIPENAVVYQNLVDAYPAVAAIAASQLAFACEGAAQ